MSGAQSLRLGAASVYPPMAHAFVTALRPLTYQGHSYVRGDHIPVDKPAEALAMQRRGDVSLTRGLKVERDAPAEPQAPAPPAPDTIETRDMEAEKPGRKPRQPRKPRQYRRRDMTAEQADE